MVFHMKTTLNIAEPVMAHLKEEAARRGTTMSALVESALRRFLGGRGEAGDRELPALPSFASGGHLVDIADREAVQRAMDES